jgi:glutathione S-transferase
MIRFVSPELMHTSAFEIMNSDTTPIIFGAPYSVYVRAVRLALEEKGVAYELVPVDIFAPDGPPAAYMARHPFGKIPALEHAGFRLYEAAAITRYIDEAFAGPPLQPTEVHDRARMMQIISILDSYAYRTLVWDIYVERVARPATGSPPDEERISAALPRAKICLSALAELMGNAIWLAGAAISLADLHAAPVFALFRRAPEGEGLLNTQRGLVAWWDRMSARDSFIRTQVPPRHEIRGG